MGNIKTKGANKNDENLRIVFLLDKIEWQLKWRFIKRLTGNWNLLQFLIVTQ